jgi:hypothetical protein
MTRDEMTLQLLRVWGEGSGEAGGADRKTILFGTHSIPEAVCPGCPRLSPDTGGCPSGDAPPECPRPSR